MRTHRSHSRIELPLWVQQTAKANTYVQIGLRSVTLWEDAYKKTDQPSETEVLYDYEYNPCDLACKPTSTLPVLFQCLAFARIA